MYFKADELGRIGFRKAAFGYNREDVDDFLEKIAEDCRESEAQIVELQNKMEKVTAERDHYRKVADSVQAAMADVQEECGRMKAEAEKKAEDMIRKAELEIRARQETAALERARLQCEADEVTKRLKLYRQKAEAMMKAQLEAFTWMDGEDSKP